MTGGGARGSGVLIERVASTRPPPHATRAKRARGALASGLHSAPALGGDAAVEGVGRLSGVVVVLAYWVGLVPTDEVDGETRSRRWHIRTRDAGGARL